MTQDYDVLVSRGVNLCIIKLFVLQIMFDFPTSPSPPKFSIWREL